MPSMDNPTRARAHEIADDLIGTSKNLDDFLEQGDIGNIELLQTIDELVVQCETCGWWVAADDVDEDGNCNEH